MQHGRCVTGMIPNDTDFNAIPQRFDGKTGNDPQANSDDSRSYDDAYFARVLVRVQNATRFFYNRVPKCGSIVVLKALEFTGKSLKSFKTYGLGPVQEHRPTAKRMNFFSMRRALRLSLSFTIREFHEKPRRKSCLF